MKQRSNKQFSINSFPRVRMRRNRLSEFSRKIVSENNISVNDLIYPIFITYGSKVKEEISSMPGIYRFSLDQLHKEIEYISSLNIPAIALFPKIENELKTPDGKEALNSNNLICEAIKISKQVNPDLGVITDVALDPYTDHGHDGIIHNNQIDNDLTLDILCKQAIVQAQAGCDILAPSDMMDGRVGAIRTALDSEGFSDVGIISYTAKYSSAYYGPFRTALDSAPKENSKKIIPDNKSTYQMDPANSKEALIESALEQYEGADILMVKPGITYLDIVDRLSTFSNKPIAAYNVSGEYSMVKSAAMKNWINEKDIVVETLLSFKRAGAKLILTYHACDASQWLQDT